MANTQTVVATTSTTSHAVYQQVQTAEIFATGAWAGGRLQGMDMNNLQSLREFGYNVGMRMAILSDCLDLKPESAHKPSDLTAVATVINY